MLLLSLLPRCKYSPSVAGMGRGAGGRREAAVPAGYGAGRCGAVRSGAEQSGRCGAVRGGAARWQHGCAVVREGTGSGSGNGVLPAGGAAAGAPGRPPGWGARQ